jgi:hypothetical protein
LGLSAPRFSKGPGERIPGPNQFRICVAPDDKDKLIRFALYHYNLALRGATPEDLKTGRAIFHLDGKGIPVALVLPALGELKDGGAQAGEGPRQVVIVQAEAAADDAITYGVIGKTS